MFSLVAPAKADIYTCGELANDSLEFEKSNNDPTKDFLRAIFFVAYVSGFRLKTLRQAKNIYFNT